MNQIPSITKIGLLLLSTFCLNQTILAQTCDCYDYLYMNDVGSNSVHKYQIQPDDGSLLEIFGPSGDTWVTGINAPHGGGIDQNGFFFVGDRTGNFPDWRLVEINCDGEIIDMDVTGSTTFSGTNIIALSPYLYAIEGNFLNVYDICSGTRLESYAHCITGSGLNEFGGGTQNWGLELGIDGNLYVTSPWNLLENPNFYTLEVYQFSTDFTTWPNDCSQSPLFTYNSVNQAWGITMDELGNFYVISRNSANNYATTILKFDPAGNLIDSVEDDNTDGTGFGNSTGIDYSPESGYLYVSSFEESCITIIDPVTMTVFAEGIPPVPGSSSKGIQIINLCCMEPTTTDYSISICPGGETNIPLRSLLPCPNSCADDALWDIPDDVVIDACTLSADFSATVNFPSCLTYNSTITSCPAVSFEVCVSLENPVEPELSVVNNDCSLPANGSINVITDCGEGSTLEYSTDAGTTWTTTPPSYDLVNPMTIIARCVSNADPNCFGPESNPVNTSPVECFNNVSLNKSVDASLKAIGDTVEFTIVVDNLLDPVTGANVIDILPPEVSFLSFSATTGTFDGTTWTIGTMNTGASETITITAIVNADGIIFNEATVSINETETNLEDNTDNVCASVPIQVCEEEPIEINLLAPNGLPMYQWYKDGIAINGATAQSYQVSSTGTYTFTSSGLPPTGTCVGELCCPVIVESIVCCEPIECIPVTITILK